MSKKASEKAIQACPKPQGTTPQGRPWKDSDMHFVRSLYIEGYEEAEKDFIALVKQYLEKGERCMNQEGESQIYAFWEGFYNCAENILMELEEEQQ